MPIVYKGIPNYSISLPKYILAIPNYKLGMPIFLLGFPFKNEFFPFYLPGRIARYAQIYFSPCKKHLIDGERHYSRRKKAR
jgi:hypothetical protein